MLVIDKHTILCGLEQILNYFHFETELKDFELAESRALATLIELRLNDYLELVIWSNLDIFHRMTKHLFNALLNPPWIWPLSSLRCNRERSRILQKHKEYLDNENNIHAEKVFAVGITP